MRITIDLNSMERSKVWWRKLAHAHAGSRPNRQMSLNMIPAGCGSRTEIGLRYVVWNNGSWKWKKVYKQN